MISGMCCHSRPSLSRTPLEAESRDEDQIRCRMHAGRAARLFRSARRQADASKTDEGGRGTDARQPAGARPGGDAEDLAAGWAQRLRAIAGDVPQPDGWPRTGEEIVMAVALRTPRLLLREWREADREPFLAVSGQPEDIPMLPPLPHPAKSGARIARAQAHLPAHGFAY